MATPFQLSDEDLNPPSSTKQGSNDDEDGRDGESNMMMDKIPILKRRAASAAAAKAANNDDGAHDGHGPDDPICVIVVGMAGSGKTTLMAQLQRSLNLKARGGRDDDGGGDAISDNTVEENNEKKPPSSSSSPGTLPSGNAGNNDSSTTPPSPSRAGYAINLDPAAKYVPFSSSIDIRDTVDYLEVMRQHKLGPNGAILTCLNLFATKFDQVMGILERRAFGTSELSGGGKGEVRDGVAGENGKGARTGGKREKDAPAAAATGANTMTGMNTTTNSSRKPPPASALKSNSSSSPPPPSSPLDYILIDTPGQIEAFTWSASGTIVTSALATTFPTVLAFVVDVPRCAASVHTFMSNMLYACSMLYRAKLPMVVVLNKTDVVGCEFVKEWMDDYESFQEALDDASAAGNNGYSDEMAGGGGGYYSSLTRSLSLVLDEFYNHLHKVGVSAATGDGVEEFWEVVQKAAAEYEEGYLVDLKHRMEEQGAKEMAKRRVGARRLVRDLKEDRNLDG